MRTTRQTEDVHCDLCGRPMSRDPYARNYTVHGGVERLFAHPMDGDERVVTIDVCGTCQRGLARQAQATRERLEKSREIAGGPRPGTLLHTR
ncbi:MAG: hypothetical protein AB7E47_02210 [Desulfovibrionaceae bacterium]